ncbi:MAG TPA: hypothetical protein PK168_01590 [Candidatus Paceibacterota bacterium]|nr:hypothetical protein [Parcubacteria group bacterium]HOM33269.1 hypothetical protein [Candidatus Paceibacterota bacterium]HPC37261.1 hypothetical protein [Candidatus Paceibacterota bacterium]HRU35718.1 hypothetical protein [Candidatus Paceibacterota bacterium]
MINKEQEKITKILRCPIETIMALEEKMTKITHKENVIEQLIKENDLITADRLERLGVKNKKTEEIYSAIIKKIIIEDKIFTQKLGNVSAAKIEDCQRVLDFIQNNLPPLYGFFLKKEKAEELFKKEPPQKILAYLGYSSVDEMLQKEDLEEIFAALRFVEDSDWLNNIFFKQYENLTAEDFETREVKLKVLSEKWRVVAEKFVAKKYHNISHLKEFGVIFVIPISLNIPGEILRMFTLILHYYYEVKFYSDVFKQYSNDVDFSQKLITILKGDLGGKLSNDSLKCEWLIIQQYLAKDDENDSRLFIPHINPEAIHWYKAGNDIINFGNLLKDDEEDFSFWRDLDWVGDFFINNEGKEELTSFNLIDNIMTLVKEKERVKYLYHHQEALWNEIFVRYFSREKLEEMIKQNLLKGVIQL